MKKRGILNRELACIVAGAGHGDLIVIADAGYPSVDGPTSIDLVLCEGIPRFMDVLRAVCEELALEKVILPEAIKNYSSGQAEAIQEYLKDTPIEYLPIPEFMDKVRSAQAIVRTGEFTPYSTIILVSGVTFNMRDDRFSVTV